MRPLQSHSKLAEIQARLNKESYLSRSILPGPSDAKMFLHLQSQKKYPDRRTPNFYHWYVVMKQFSIHSIEKWLENSNKTQEDPLINYFTQRKLNDKIPSYSSCFKKPPTGLQISHDETNKLAKSEDYSNTQGHQIEYVMDVKIKEGIHRNVKEILTRFMVQQSIQGHEVKELPQQRRVRVVTKMDHQKFQILKNKISALEEVETFESKKKDKRFKAHNSSSNYSAEV